MKDSVNQSARTRGSFLNISLWVLQVASAFVFIKAGGAKLAGVQAMVQLFDHVGFGQWFRYLTGGLEIAGAVALLIPGFYRPGAILLAVIMAGAVLTHLLIIGGNPALPIVLFLLLCLIAWARQDRNRPYRVLTLTNRTFRANP